MIDVTSLAVRAICEKSTSAIPLAFVCGAAVSVGPCVAPRLLTAAALTAGKPFRESAQIVGSFMAGVATSYILLAVSGSFIWRVMTASSYAYLGAGSALAAIGSATLLRRDAGCVHRTSAAKSLGATFLLGSSSAAMLSPCCFPLIVAIAAYAGNAGILLTSATAGAFALGHSAPLVFAAAGVRTALAWDLGGAIARAAQVTGASLMLALAGFYGLLA